MNAIDKKIFSKKQRLNMLIEAQENLCGAVQNAIWRTEKNYPLVNISYLHLKYAIHTNRLAKLIKIKYETISSL